MVRVPWAPARPRHVEKNFTPHRRAARRGVATVLQNLLVQIQGIFAARLASKFQSRVRLDDGSCLHNQPHTGRPAGGDPIQENNNTYV